jgi:hypothetical protein
VRPAALESPRGEEVLTRAWAPDDTAPAKGRMLVESWAPKLDREVLQVARLLVSEVISLSIRSQEHGGTQSDLEVSLKLNPWRMRVEVTREAARFIFPTADAETADLSLSLVDELADRWGMSRTGNGTVCWLEIDC